jgi:hypothetical protein
MDASLFICIFNPFWMFAETLLTFAYFPVWVDVDQMPY